MNGTPTYASCRDAFGGERHVHCIPLLPYTEFSTEIILDGIPQGTDWKLNTPLRFRGESIPQHHFPEYLKSWHILNRYSMFASVLLLLLGEEMTVHSVKALISLFQELEH